MWSWQSYTSAAGLHRLTVFELTQTCRTPGHPPPPVQYCRVGRAGSPRSRSGRPGCPRAGSGTPVHLYAADLRHVGELRTSISRNSTSAAPGTGSHRAGRAVWRRILRRRRPGAGGRFAAVRQVGQRASVGCAARLELFRGMSTVVTKLVAIKYMLMITAAVSSLRRDLRAAPGNRAG
jgi:hypothetical protein